MALRFCVQCKITSDDLMKDLYKFWALGDKQHPYLFNPLCSQVESCANDILHCLIRLAEAFLGPTMERMNREIGGPREAHSRYISEVCGFPFVFFGENTAPNSGKKTVSTHTSLSGGKWLKFLHSFDLERVYTERELFLAKILFSLFAVIMFALGRKQGSIGFLTGKQIRVLSLLLIDTYISLEGKSPAARYVHYLTTHMCEFKDKLSKLGLDLMVILQRPHYPGTPTPLTPVR